MAIQINKDFLSEYKDDAWKGFSVRELLCLAGAAAVGITVDALLHFYAGFSLAAGVYVAFPLMLPLILIGFYKYQGYLTVGNFLSEWFYELRTAQVKYCSGEGVEKEYVYREGAYSSNKESQEYRKVKGKPCRIQKRKTGGT